MRSWCWLWSAQDIECSTLMWTEEIMMYTRKIATIFMSIASKKHTRFCFSWYWQIYSTIIKYTESEESLRGVLQELWYNIPSGTITSLRADNRLPSTDPDVVNILRQFDSSSNFHTNYGQRLTGYLQVLSSNIIFFCKIWSHIMLINMNFKVLYKNRYRLSTKNPKRIVGILFF